MKKISYKVIIELFIVFLGLLAIGVSCLSKKENLEL